MPTSEPDCPFCRVIARSDEQVREVYRDNDVVAFFPTEPATLGHTLIAPREHVSDIWHLSEETADRLAQATVRLAGVVRDAVDPEGLNIIQSNGLVATQTVFHLHIHLVPRWEGDAMGQIWPEETAYSDTEKDQALSAIQEACRTMKR